MSLAARTGGRFVPVDLTVVRGMCALRLAFLIGVALAGSFLGHMTGGRAALMFVIDLVWIPWATLLLFGSESGAGRLVRVAGPAGDLVLLLVAQSVFPASNQALLLGYLLVVVFAVYTAGRAAAAANGAGAIALSWLAQTVVPPEHRLSTAVVASFNVVVAVSVVLLERTATMRAQAATRYAWLESKADTILAHVAEAVVVTGPDGLVSQCNPAAHRLFGPAGGELTGRHCSEALGLHRGERTLDCSLSCGLLSPDLTAQVTDGVEVWRRGSGGERQPLLASATRVASDDGRVEVVHSVRDVTRLKQAEEAKTLFLATATHELKTPLTVIQGFAETLVAYEDLDPGLKTAALEAIRGRAGELARIIDRLLLSSRIEAGRLELALSAVEPAAIVAERAATFSAATGRSIECRVSDGLPAVRANPDAVETVVDHLIDNALKYSPGGEPVSVSLTALRGDGPQGVRIEVADRGVGMDPEQVTHCFERFWQAESTDVRRFGGTGIGLYIVESLVEAMGGTVEVASTRGAGSVFSVQLFAAPAPAPEVRLGESTSIREFMRQIGVPERRTQ